MRIGIVGIVIVFLGTLAQPARAVEEVTRPLREFGRGRIQYAAYTGGGAQIWSSNWGKVDVWDAIDGTPSTDLPVVPMGRYNGISLDGHIALQSAGNQTSVVDLDTSTVLRTLPFAGSPSDTVSPDGSLGYIESQGMVDLRTGEVLCLLYEEGRPSFTADSSRVVVSGDSLVDSRTGETIRVFWLGGLVAKGAISADGERVLAVNYDGEAVVWDAETFESLHSFTSLYRAENCAISSDGRRALIASPQPVEYQFELWDIDDETRIATFSEHFTEITSLAFSPDGSHFFVSDDAHIRIWDTATLETTGVVDAFSGRARSLNFSPDGTRILSMHSDGTARVWDSRSGDELLRLIGGGGDAEYSPDGTRILTSGGGSARLWDARTGNQLSVYPHQYLLSDSAFSPDGRNFVTVSYEDYMDPVLRIWDVDSTAPLAIVHAREVREDVEYLPDGSAILVPGYDSFTLRNASTGEILRSFPAGISPPLVIDPTGRFYVDRRLQVVEIATGTVLKAGQEGLGSWNLDLSPDGLRVLRGDYGRAYLDDLGSGEVLRVFKGYSAEVRFSPDGRTVLTAGWDGPIRLWDSGLAPYELGESWVIR